VRTTPLMSGPLSGRVAVIVGVTLRHLSDALNVSEIRGAVGRDIAVWGPRTVHVTNPAKRIRGTAW
jgi:hypothetical protein